MLEHALHTLIPWLDIIGIAVFAISGALEASRREMDIIGFILIATVTAIGGGTIRDVLLGIAPVSWVTTPYILYICISCALFVFVAAPRIESRFKIILWADAIGISVFCIIGTQKALDVGVSSAVAIIMGAITATFGGLVRDIICAQMPLVLRREIYVTAAAFGSGIYVWLHHMGLPPSVVIICAFLSAFTIRALALIYRLSLPRYKSRPGRVL